MTKSSPSPAASPLRRARRQLCLRAGDIHRDVEFAVGVKRDCSAAARCRAFSSTAPCRRRHRSREFAGAGDLINAIADQHRRTGQRADRIAPLFELLRLERPAAPAATAGVISRCGILNAAMRPTSLVSMFSLSCDDDDACPCIRRRRALMPPFAPALATGVRKSGSPVRALTQTRLLVAARGIEHALAIEEAEPRMRERVVLRPTRRARWTRRVRRSFCRRHRSDRPAGRTRPTPW